MHFRPALNKTAELGIGLVAITTLILAGCGGGGGGNTSSGTSGTSTGVVYPVVAGLAYSTNSASGVVAANGSYSYKANENVTFSAGGIELNTVPAAANVTPLPLGNDVASANLLRLLKALDTDHDLSNGVTLPALPASNSTIDLTSEASVAAALASLSPTATLPIASDAQVATALASTKTTALQNMGTYGTTYNTIIQSTLVGTHRAYYPKDATVSLTSQPDWSTGSMSGTATLTLNDNSQVTFSFNSATGTYTALGVTVSYQFGKDWEARSRIIHLYYYGDGTCAATRPCGNLVLRDNSQPNMPPVAGNYGIVSVGGSFNTYTWCTGWSSAASLVLDGSGDFDGLITSVTLTSNKGKTVSMDLNIPTVGPACVSEIYYPNETAGVTVTVTDDEGATSTKTYGSSSSGTPATGGTSTLTLAGSVNSSLAMTYIGESGPPVAKGSGFFHMYDGSSSATYQSITDYGRGWSTNSTLTNAANTLAAGDAVLAGHFYVDKTTNAVVFSMQGIICSKDRCTNSTAGTTVLALGKGASTGGCLVGTGPSPSCASAGINVNRSSGTISFTNTPMVTGTVSSTGALTASGSATLNGTLTFTPF